MLAVTRVCGSKGKKEDEKKKKKTKDDMYCLYYTEKEKREDGPRTIHNGGFEWMFSVIF
jgi:hypothetical protein